MRLLEYESKQILKKYRLRIPDAVLVTSPDQTQSHPDFPVVLKAQIPLGGRGKAGGVLEANSREEASAEINTLFSKQIRGYRARRVLVESKVDIQHEF